MLHSGMWARAVLVVVAVSGAALATSDQEYCNLCSSHTMCLYAGVGAACSQGRFERGVAAAEQATVVAEHNRLRNTVALGEETRGAPGPQPSAANMQLMVWDDELATVAQRWADQCTYQHDSCRNVPRYYVGQNLYLKGVWPCSSMDSVPNWSEAIQAWYNEVKDFDANSVTNFQSGSASGAQIGHYTQVVWGKSNRIGCGYTLFQDGEWCKKYYVCNYGPGGNYIGQSVYTPGPPRSQCPSSTPTDANYKGLC